MTRFLVLISLFFGSQAYASCSLFYNMGMYERAIKSGQESSKSGMASFSELTCLGDVFFDTGLFADAMNAYKLSLSKAKTSAQKSEVFQNLGRSMMYLGMNEEAINYLNQKVDLDRKRNNIEGWGAALATLSAIYGNMGEHEKAIEMALVSLGKMKGYKNISATYNNIAIEYSQLGDLDSAITYINKAIKVDIDNQDKKYHGIHLITKGGFLKKTELAIEILVEGIQKVKDEEDLYWEMYGYMTMSEAYIYSGNLKEAHNSILLSEAIVSKLNNKTEADYVASIKQYIEDSL